MLALRIGNDVSYEARINHEIHFAWQAQYLVKSDCLFVAGAAFGDILGDSRSAKCCIFQYKIVSKIGRVRSPKRRVRDDDFILGSWSDHGRIMVGLSSNRLYIGGSNSESFRCNLELKDFMAGAVFAEVGG